MLHAKQALDELGLLQDLFPTLADSITKLITKLM